MINSTSVSLAFALFIIIRWEPWRIGRRESDLPPGPPTTFILGNVLQMPTLFPQIKFTEWSQKFGEIYSLKVLNRNIIVLSSPRVIKEILDKQGLRTGDRLNPYIATRVEKDYMINRNLDSHLWKVTRKAMNTFLGTENLEVKHLPAQAAETSQFLNDILESPSDIYVHIKRMLVSTMAYMVFGKRLPRYEGVAEDIYLGIRLWSETMDVTAHPPIDILPFLKYVPARWAPWKKLCQRASQVRQKVYGDLFNVCENMAKTGVLTGSYVEQVILSETLELNRDEVRGLAHVLMDAGSQTATDVIDNFILALINYPECQKKAQAEVDRVIGRDRMPTVEDLEHLPYLHAFIKEVHRLCPVVPTGVPHVVSADVKYRDYIIPKGSVIMSNTWGIYRDPNYFEDPETFNPDRYLQSEFGTRTDLDVDLEGFRHSLPFGSGRRICPGMNMATKTIENNTMNPIWAFTFSKDNSGTGNMGLESYLKPGAEMTPAPFTCQVVVRDDKTAKMIRDQYSESSGIQGKGVV